MPDYSTNDPKGWCGDPSRGAALGRPTIKDGPPEGPITVRESHLDLGGYDYNGTYFGNGAPLFWYADESGNIDACERAPEVSVMVDRLKGRYPTTPIVVSEAIQPKCWGHGDGACPDKALAREPYSDYCEVCEYLNEVGEEDEDEHEDE